MTKKRTMNELRQTKDAHYVNPTFKVGNQGGDFIKPTNTPAKSTGEILKEYVDLEVEQKDEIEQAKELIVNKIIRHFDDTLFEMVCEEMSDNFLFQSDNYLTEAGFDMFEDEWFEFFHEHHGDILHQVKQGLTN